MSSGLASDTWRVVNGESVGDHWNIGELEMYDAGGVLLKCISQVICSHNYRNHDLAMVHNGNYFTGGGGDRRTWAGADSEEGQRAGGSWLGFVFEEVVQVVKVRMAQGSNKDQRVSVVWLEVKIGDEWNRVSIIEGDDLCLTEDDEAITQIETPSCVCSDVFCTDEFEGFTQMISAAGVTYVAGPEIPIRFLVAIGKVTEEMFTPSDQISAAKQELVMKNNSARRAMCPVFRKDAHRRLCSKFGRPFRQHDVINLHKDPCSQLPEVLEHVLHHVTDVGMAGAFPDDWGRRRGSRLNAAFEEALEKDLHVPCKPYRGKNLKIELQEFAWWIFGTYWDLGDLIEIPNREWKIESREDMREKLPLTYALCHDYADTLTPPGRETLLTLRAFADPTIARN